MRDGKLDLRKIGQKPLLSCQDFINKSYSCHYYFDVYGSIEELGKTSVTSFIECPLSRRRKK